MPETPVTTPRSRAASGAIGLPRRAALAAPALLLAARPARAAWPERPVRIVVAFPPGSGTDIMARILAEPLARELGQPVVIDNRPGGNGIVGTQAAALAPADGHTLLVISTSAASINPHTLKRLPYDALRDFAPIGSLAEGPYVMVVPPSSPAQDLKGFLALARERPGELTYSYGNASAIIMASVMASMAGVQLTGVPYRGGAEALADVVSGRIDCTFADFGAGMAQVNAGRVRLLGQSLGRPFEVAPDLPKVADAVPGFDINVWWGLAAPAGVAPAIIEGANRALNAALADPGLSERLRGLGYVTMRMTPAEFGDYMRRQVVVWGERVRIAGIEPQ
jgi:tripartite-type tricarboxylate transporter receptor subunit TctC